MMPKKRPPVGYPAAEEICYAPDREAGCATFGLPQLAQRIVTALLWSGRRRPEISPHLVVTALIQP
jgi:hypothetical protein